MALDGGYFKGTNGCSQWFLLFGIEETDCSQGIKRFDKIHKRIEGNVKRFKKNHKWNSAQNPIKSRFILETSNQKE